MATLSSAAWAVHEVGLATAIGGTLFGRAALEPALHEIKSPEERDLVSAEAWQRFSWMNLSGHVAFAATWLIGRTMLSGREVSGTARTLTKVKDGMVIASVITGVTSILLGRQLAVRSRRGVGPEHVRESGDRKGDRQAKTTRAMERAVGGLGILNLVTNVGIAAITAILGMEANKSVRFAPRSRWLP
jgi:hypothetical protein